MILRIDPRIAVVWRDPHTLQFGVTAPRVVLENVTELDERLVSALRAGVARSGLDMIAIQGGGCRDDAARMLDRLRDALAAEAEPAAHTVTVCGAGPTAQALTTDLAARGVAVALADDPRAAVSRPCELAVIVSRFVVPPELHGLFLRRDIPHLAVVVGDEHVELGPVVEPGSGPCLHCLHRYRTDSDAAWPAIASQLWGRAAADESALVASEAAAAAARLVLARLENGPSREHRSIRLAVATGERATTLWAPHPECGCLDPARGGWGSSVTPGAVPGASAVSRARRGTDSVAAFLPTRWTVRPTTGSNAGAPG